MALGRNIVLLRTFNVLYIGMYSLAAALLYTCYKEVIIATCQYECIVSRVNTWEGVGASLAVSSNNDVILVL